MSPEGNSVLPPILSTDAPRLEILLGIYYWQLVCRVATINGHQPEWKKHHRRPNLYEERDQLRGSIHMTDPWLATAKNFGC